MSTYKKPLLKKSIWAPQLKAKGAKTGDEQQGQGKQEKDKKDQGTKTVAYSAERITKDLAEEVDMGRTMTMQFGEPHDLYNFTLIIEPDEGMYKGGSFHLQFQLPQDYPFKPPKVRLVGQIYHPNFDLEGNPCLNILREDWSPVWQLKSVCFGLQFLFLEPNASDPLNKEAAQDLRDNRENFKRNVRTALAGGAVKGKTYTRMLK